jgi:hypothetical protein
MKNGSKEQIKQTAMYDEGFKERMFEILNDRENKVEKNVINEKYIKRKLE